MEKCAIMLIMKRFIILTGIFIVSAFAVFANESNEIIVNSGEPVVTGGFADLGEMSVGNAEKTVLIDDAAYPDAKKKRKAFTDAVNGFKYQIIIVSGDVDLSDGKISDKDHSYFDYKKDQVERSAMDIVYPISGNKTIIGINNARLMFGGFRLKGASNVIIRNVCFYDAHGATEKNTKKYPNSKASADALYLEDVNGVWIDHCTFTDGKCRDLERNFNHDGQLDIAAGKNITVSYCEFTNHDKVMLVGKGDAYTERKDRQLTLHHNYFHGAIQRMPRSRGCMIHIYNNFYDDIGTSGNSGQGLGPGIASDYIVENNLFGAFASTIVKYYDSSESAKARTFSKFYESGNSPKLADSKCAYDKVDKVKDFKAHLVSEKPFETLYGYQLEEAKELKKTVPVEAGFGKKVIVNGVEY